MNKGITLLLVGVIFLALLLMVFNSFTMEEQRGVPASTTEKARPQEVPPAASAPMERPTPAPALEPVAPAVRDSATLPPSPQKAAPLPAEITPPASAAEAPPAEGNAVRTVPAQIDAGQRSPAVAAPQADAPSLPPPPKIPFMPEPGAKQTSGGSKNITNIVVYATQEGATLRLTGDKPLEYTSMMLRDPVRLVLDFAGHWNANVPGVPQNRLIKAIRVGRQADATRMVIDLHRTPASYRLVKTSPQGLDVRLR